MMKNKRTVIGWTTHHLNWDSWCNAQAVLLLGHYVVDMLPCFMSFTTAIIACSTSAGMWLVNMWWRYAQESGLSTGRTTIIFLHTVNCVEAPESSWASWITEQWLLVVFLPSHPPSVSKLDIVDHLQSYIWEHIHSNNNSLYSHKFKATCDKVWTGH